jgi:hypothetical protein
MNDTIFKGVRVCKLMESTKDKEHRDVNFITNDEQLTEYIVNDDAHACELIHNQQIKPVLDIDVVYEVSPCAQKNTTLKNNILKAYSQIINLTVFPGHNVCASERDIRRFEKNGKLHEKIGLRLIVQGVRISPENLKKIMTELDVKPILSQNYHDLSIYSKNRCLYLPYSVKHGEKACGDYPLKPIGDNCLFDYCCTYIEEGYVNWDEMMPKDTAVITKPEEVKRDQIDKTKMEKTIKTLKSWITHLSPSRACEYEMWRNIMFSVISICYNNNVNKRSMLELSHMFSQLDQINYEEDKVDDWIDKNYDLIKRRVDNNENCYGWKLIKDCLKDDDPEFYDKTFTLMYHEKKKEWERIHCKIVHPPMYITELNDHLFGGKKIMKQPLSNFTASYSHEKCKVKNKKTEEFVEENFLNIWYTDKNIRRYDECTFMPPPLKCPPELYNTWTDYPIFEEPLPEGFDIENNEYIDLFVNTLHILLQKNDFYTKFNTAVFAQFVQNPGLRTGLSLIYYSSNVNQGAGKNRIFDVIACILGYKFVEIDSTKKLYEKHATFEEGRILVLINEANPSENFENDNVFKSRCTSSTLEVNPKGIAPYTIPNYCNYAQTTNNKYCVFPGRRIAPFECSDELVGNVDYWNNYSEKLCHDPHNYNKVAIRCIAEYLLRFPIKDVIPNGNFQASKPNTKYLKELEVHFMNGHWAFLKNLCQTFTAKTFTLTNQALWDSYIAYCKEMNIKYDKLNQRTFNKYFCDNIVNKLEKNADYSNAIKITRTRTNGVRVWGKEFNRQLCIEYMDKFVLCEDEDISFIEEE